MNPAIILILLAGVGIAAYAKSQSGNTSSDATTDTGFKFFNFTTPASDVATSSQNDFMDHPSTFTSNQWRRFDTQFKAAGTKWGVDWTWLKALCLNESYLGTDPRVVAGNTSQDGKSWGVMQFTLPTASDMLGRVATIDDLNDPDLSIDIAGKYIWLMSARFGGDQRKVIMSYNQGAGATAQGKEYAADYYERFVRNLKLVTDYLT